MTGQYGDVEQIVGQWLSAYLSVRTCSELPATLPSEIVQVVRFGGSRPTIPFDDATVDVDCYTLTRAASLALAERVCQGLCSVLPGTRVGQVVVLSAECISAPVWAPYDNTSVRRNTATYLIRTHNPL